MQIYNINICAFIFKGKFFDISSDSFTLRNIFAMNLYDYKHVIGTIINQAIEVRYSLKTVFCKNLIYCDMLHQSLCIMKQN